MRFNRRGGLCGSACGCGARVPHSIRAGGIPGGGEIVSRRGRDEAPRARRTSGNLSRPIHRSSDERDWASPRVRPLYAAGLYSPADASQLQEIVNPLLASKRCLRSSPLKKARRAFETDTGMVEPSCFTSTCVGPFARSSYENLTEYVCKVPPQFVRIERRGMAPAAFPFDSIRSLAYSSFPFSSIAEPTFFFGLHGGSVVEAEEVPVG